jgi:hypothetical protein
MGVWRIEGEAFVPCLPRRSASGARGPLRTLRHKVPDRLTPSGMTAFGLTNPFIGFPASGEAATATTETRRFPIYGEAGREAD